MATTIQISRLGGPEVLKSVEFACPAPAAGQLKVAVKAAGVNFADVMMRMGLYPEAPKPPFSPGYEVAGTVLEIGAGVTGFRAGDRVLAGCRFGGYATELLVDAAGARAIPPRISEIEAAAIPVNYITAGIALWTMARVRAGDRVLIPNAAGGVGIAAAQIARQAGACVTGTVSSEAKFAAVREHGGPKTEALTYAQLDAQPGARFDIILDAAGGSAAKRHLKRLAPAGRLVCFGVGEMVGGRKRSAWRAVKSLVKMPILTPLGLMMANYGVFGLNLLKIFQLYPDLAAQALDQVLRGVSDGSLRPVVGRTFPLSHAGEAHAHLMSRANIGKIVLTNP